MIGLRFLNLPKPLITPMPMIVTILVGLVIWTIAYNFPVPYPQETMAPYSDSSPATMELGRPQGLVAHAKATAGDQRGQPVRTPSQSHTNPQS